MTWEKIPDDDVEAHDAWTEWHQKKVRCGSTLSGPSGEPVLITRTTLRNLARSAFLAGLQAGRESKERKR